MSAYVSTRVVLKFVPLSAEGIFLPQFAVKVSLTEFYDLTRETADILIQHVTRMIEKGLVYIIKLYHMALISQSEKAEQRYDNKITTKLQATGFVYCAHIVDSYVQNGIDHSPF